MPHDGAASIAAKLPPITNAPTCDPDSPTTSRPLTLTRRLAPSGPVAASPAVSATSSVGRRISDLRRDGWDCPSCPPTSQSGASDAGSSSEMATATATTNQKAMRQFTSAPMPPTSGAASCPSDWKAA